MKKSSIVLWCVAALFLISSFTLIGSNLPAAICGVLLSAVLAFIGYKKLRKAPSKIETSEVSVPFEPDNRYNFLKTKVAGVSFNNGRKSRQTILRRIYWRDEPFNNGKIDLTLERGEFEGKPAFGVYANGEQIGFVPSEHSSFVEENFDRCDGITHIDVYGGGEGRNYGAEIIIRFRKSDPQ